jgi:hypothetical protein
MKQKNTETLPRSLEAIGEMENRKIGPIGHIGPIDAKDE